MTHRKGKAGVFVKGGKPGPGRPKGSKDSIPRMTRKEMSEFFLSCTVDNLKWRQNFKRKLEAAKPAGEVIIDAADERDEANGFEAVKPSPADPSAPRDLEPPIYPPPRERDRPPRDSNR